MFFVLCGVIILGRLQGKFELIYLRSERVKTLAERKKEVLPLKLMTKTNGVATFTEIQGKTEL